MHLFSLCFLFNITRPQLSNNYLPRDFSSILPLHDGFEFTNMLSVTSHIGKKKRMVQCMVNKSPKKKMKTQHAHMTASGKNTPIYISSLPVYPPYPSIYLDRSLSLSLYVYITVEYLYGQISLLNQCSGRGRRYSHHHWRRRGGRWIPSEKEREIALEENGMETCGSRRLFFCFRAEGGRAEGGRTERERERERLVSYWSALSGITSLSLSLLERTRISH